MKSKYWTWFSTVGLLAVLALALAACQPGEPEVVEVEVTREVEVETVVEVPVEEEMEEPEPITRTGAWLDTVIMLEEPSSDAAVSRLEAGDIDIYAYNISEPDIADRILASDQLVYETSYGNYNELTLNPAGPILEDGSLNPFAVPAIREAMNWVVDRNFIAEEISGGLARPRYVPINLASKDFAELADVVAAIELRYRYDLERAREVITAEMEALGATMEGGVWTYEGEPVELIGLIRTEDERQEIGDYVANQLEDLGFTVIRDYKTSAEASPCWIQSDPAGGCFNYYTGGWVSTAISRDEASNFDFFYTARGLPFPLWQAYAPAQEFDDVSFQLGTSEFSTTEERRELMAQALELSLQDSVRVWIKDDIGYAPHVAGTSIASDLSGSIYGSALWGYTVQFDGEIGGSMTIAMPSIMTEPWNALAGSNWVYDQMPIRGTGESALVPDPFTGLNLPNKIDRAEVTVQEDLPVGATLDWVTLDTAAEITVPEDAWADWDPVTQTFITVGEKFPDGATALRKSVVYYPEDLYETVTWHDGSPFSIADVVTVMAATFDFADEESANFDPAYVPDFESFIATFKGVRIVSEDPLVIETYSDFWLLDAEQIVDTWWPMYDQGQAAWHALAPGLLADANLEAAFSNDKAGANEIEWLSYIAGPTLEILQANLDIAEAEGTFPYAPTLGNYVTPEEAATRYANLQEWVRRRGHFWVGTGPFYLERAFPVEGTLILQRYVDYPDLATKWARFAAPPIAEVAVEGPAQVTVGEEASFDINVSFEGAPYAAEDINLVRFLVFDATGALAHVGDAESMGDGVWTATLGSDVTGALPEGSNQLQVVVGPLRVLLPTIESLQFVTAP